MGIDYFYDDFLIITIEKFTTLIIDAKYKSLPSTKRKQPLDVLIPTTKEHYKAK